MPNWCDTTYNITCSEDTRKAICDAYYAVDNTNKIQNKEYEEEYKKLKDKGHREEDIYTELRLKGIYPYYDVWLYHMLRELGYSEEFLSKFNGNIRGYITDFDDTEPEKLTLRCDTAWCESYGFRQLLQDKFHDDESLNILYTAEEPGMEVYLTNDPDYDGTYIVDIENDSYDYESEDSVIRIVNDRLKCQCTTIKEALEAAKNHNDFTEDDDHIWIHMFKYCND